MILFTDQITGYTFSKLNSFCFPIVFSMMNFSSLTKKTEDKVHIIV